MPVGATLMVARHGLLADVTSSMNGQYPHPRVTIKVAPTEISMVVEFTTNIRYK